MKTLFIALSVFMACSGAFAATTGLRGNAATDIGALQSNDSIVVDRTNVTGAYKTTPAGITSYVQGQLSGILAPSYHNHSTATSSRSGYQSSTDKERFDAMYASTVPNSATEGAIGSGTWTSLATAGYTVESAQAKWPYLTSDGTLTGTHLIASSAELTSYGVDWAAVQSCVYKSADLNSYCLLLAGSYVVERTINLPIYAQIHGVNAVQQSYTVTSHIKSKIYRHSTFNSPYTLIKANGLNVIQNIGLLSTTARERVITGIDILSSGVSINGCLFENLKYAVYSNVLNVNGAYQTYRNIIIDNNFMLAVGVLLYVTGSSQTGVDGAATFVGDFTNNSAYSGDGYTYCKTSAGIFIGNTMGIALRVINNKFMYMDHIIYHVNTNTMYYDGPNIYIDNNTFQGGNDLVVNSDLPIITISYGSTGGTARAIITNNYFQTDWYNGMSAAIKLCSGMRFLVSGNTTDHFSTTLVEMTCGKTNGEDMIVVSNNVKQAGYISGGKMLRSSITNGGVVRATVVGNSSDSERAQLNESSFVGILFDQLPKVTKYLSNEISLNISSPEFDKVVKLIPNGSRRNTSVTLFNPLYCPNTFTAINEDPLYSLTLFPPSNTTMLNLSGSTVPSVTITGRGSVEFAPIYRNAIQYWTQIK